MVLGLFVLGANTASTAQHTSPTTKTVQVASPQNTAMISMIRPDVTMDNVTPNTLMSSAAAAVASNRRICLELMRLFDRVCASAAQSRPVCQHVSMSAFTEGNRTTDGRLEIEADDPGCVKTSSGGASKNCFLCCGLHKCVERIAGS